jgi:macrodomain Ter protein organizer (MatP/YcbG family)
VLPLDAEDIAMARLQAQLRERETIQPSRRGAEASPARRTSVQLPVSLWEQARDRARRDGRTVSQVVHAALARYLAQR